VTERTEAWRADWKDSFEDFTAPPGPSGWAPVPRRRHAAVIGGLVVLVAAMGTAAWATTRPATNGPEQSTPTGHQAGQAPPAAAGPVVPPAASSSPPPSASSSSPASPTGGGSLAPVPAVPSGGVPAITPPATHEHASPSQVHTIATPTGRITRGDLATPTSAAETWLARWCSFDYHQPFGASEKRAKAAMTSAGWAEFAPAGNQRERASWNKTVAAKETGKCSRPAASINPEAPRSKDLAVVRVRAERVVHGAGEKPYVEPVTAQRVVKRGKDGLWRVGRASEGG
jgi:hypothetical protein